MRTICRTLVFCGFAWLSSAMDGPAAELPREVQSAACRTVPEIDGVVAPEEWQDATTLPFTWTLFDKDTLQTGKTEAPRECQLRVMNSANALYIALVVPDPTVNKSLAPVNVDAALVAFAQDDTLRVGDDRKLVFPGVHVDKHFSQPGKDEDDKQSHGRGAMTQQDGNCSVEWAIPLNSGDPEDVQAKPGDTLRWNLTYFDGFQADLAGTKLGVAWGQSLDQATDWGVLHLAENVEDDGGLAFRAPAWVEDLVKNHPAIAAGRMRLTETALMPRATEPVAKVLVEYQYRDTAGTEQTAKAKMYFPASARKSEKRFPLFYAAGYELDDGSAVGHVERGLVVVSPRELKANPLVQTPNPDVALLHIARALPMIDAGRVIVGGGSAGGYMTLMLAAETFPLAGAAADVPPVNWGYNAEYFLQRKKWPQQPKSEELPLFLSVAPIADQAALLYGQDTADPIWYRNSPLAQLDTITGPVLAFWSTADVLVPIDQVGKSWVRPFQPSQFPVGFTQSPETLSSCADLYARALERLPESDYELFVFQEEQIKQLLPTNAATAVTSELPFSRTKRWSITILDEGAPEPSVGHLKYSVPWTRNQFIDHMAQQSISIDQLTMTKLQRLMDRYAGREWLPTRLLHLDYPECERADVVRGLRSYVQTSERHAAHFSELYGQLPEDRRVLEAEVLQSLAPRGK
jgi:hypothetical protein